MVFLGTVMRSPSLLVIGALVLFIYVYNLISEHSTQAFLWLIGLILVGLIFLLVDLFATKRNSKHTKEQ